MDLLLITNYHSIQLDVVDHKRSFAGHTIYRIVLKAFKSGISEPALDIFVWRRYSEIKKLHKELKSIFSQNQDDASLFPEFIKGKIFGRFENHIIEERRQSTASFLAYVASQPFLCKSNAFKNFFEGAVKSSLYRSQYAPTDAPIFLEADQNPLQLINANEQVEIPQNSVENEEDREMVNTQQATWNNRQPTPEILTDGNIAGNIQYIEPLSENDSLSSEHYTRLSENDTQVRHNKPLVAENVSLALEIDTLSTESESFIQGNVSLSSENDNFASENDNFASKNDNSTLKDETVTSENDNFASKNDNLTLKEETVTSGNDNFAFENDNLTLKVQSVTSENGKSPSKNDNFSSENDSATSKNDNFVSKSETLADQSDLDYFATDRIKMEHDKDKVNDPNLLQVDEEDATDDRDDVFDENEDFDEEGRRWLRTAFSVCSEGDDIEKLASEADDSVVFQSDIHSLDSIKELDDVTARTPNNMVEDNCGNIASPVPCNDNQEESNPGLCCEESTKDRRIINVDELNIDKGRVEADDANFDRNQNFPKDEDIKSSKCEEQGFQTIMMNSVTTIVNSGMDTAEVNLAPKQIASPENDTNLVPANNNESSKTNSSDASCSLPFAFDEGMTKQIRKMIKNDDYIYHASLAMSEAIDHEEQKKFESSFEMYKLGIGLLLEGVKRENNEERRQAVRRKTAQYLLKAESLYRTYLSKTKTSWNSPSQAITLAEVKSLGVVDKVILVQLRNSEVFIMKVLHKCGCDYKNSKTMKIRDRKYVNSKYMVKVFYHTENTTGVYLLLEYIPTGLLWHYLDSEWRLSSFDTLEDEANSNLTKNGGKELTVDDRPPEDLIRIWASEIVVTLEDLHKSGIICRDLNPRNILLDETGHIKLTYFSNLKGIEYGINEAAIHRSYAAPECRGVFELTKAADWWSLGAILFELLTGKSLYSCYPGGIHSHSIINLPKPVSNEAWSLLAGLLRYNPKDRLGAGVAGCEEIKSHPFFSSVDWEKLEI